MKFTRKVKGKDGKTYEIPCDPSDPTPVAVATELNRPETQDERVRRIIREQIRPQEQGYETEEDNNDLEVDDDENFMGELPLTEAEAEYIASKHGDVIEEILTPLSSPATEAKEPQESKAAPVDSKTEEKTDENDII